MEGKPDAPPHVGDTLAEGEEIWNSVQFVKHIIGILSHK